MSSNHNQTPDFYETLEISPNANVDTINRVFRYLAQRYHPDHKDTGNAEKFARIVKAHETLKDPEKRANYDIHHQQNSEYHWNLVEEAGQWEDFETDEIIQARILSMLYVKRKRDLHNPGSANFEIEQLTGCPNEILDFHLWYLKEKGWILRMEDGLLAITADGVDKSLTTHHTQRTEKFITDQRAAIHL